MWSKKSKHIKINEGSDSMDYKVILISLSKYVII